MHTNKTFSKNDLSHKWWTLASEKVAELLHANIEKGLSSDEATQRLEKFGLNEIESEPSPSIWKIILDQFNSFIIWVLFVAAAISFALGQWVDASVILGILVINSILGFVQEYQAEKALLALKKLSQPNSKVIRDGKVQIIASNKITLGDLVLLEAGDLIPADGRIIEATRMSVQEATLTGESSPVYKTLDPLLNADLGLGDRTNMGFMATIIASGKGKLLVTEIGKNTEVGKISMMLLREKDVQTPLQRRLEQLGRRLVFFCLIIVIIVFILGLLGHHTFRNMLMISLSLAVSAVPEGLPTILTVALALGIQKMTKRKALIRKLPAVETLGCTTVICTDKTGTLTQNEMTVSEIWINQKTIAVTGTGYTPEGEFELDNKKINPNDFKELMLILKAAVLCNSAHLLQENNNWKISGDPTEGSLLTAAKKAGLDKKQLEEENPLLGEIPFSSERKKMSTLRKTPEGLIIFVKGAPDIILQTSAFFLQNSEEIKLTEENRQHIEQIYHQLSQHGLRLLGFAYKKSGENKIDESMEKDLVFLGLIAMKDPLRDEAKEAIQSCQSAGIQIAMITGDYKETAMAIAKELGIMNKQFIAIDDRELSKMNDEQLKEKVDKISVYSRVSPEYKLRIIKAWKERNQIIAMTGDGVNDAPAIKAADIGIAMGITGTEVAKEASDMVILDDNFATIVHAVEEGRGIYDNIIKFITYLFSSNIAELLVIIIGMLIGFWNNQWSHFIPLIPVQILWLNLVTDGFPAVALAMDPIDPKTMEHPPRDPSSPIINRQLGIQIFFVSLVVALGALTACYIGLQQSQVLAQTMTFTTLVVLELVRIQTVRMPYNIGWLSNPWLIIAVLTSIIAQLIAIYVPFFQFLLGTVGLSFSHWLHITIITIVVWILVVLISWRFTDNK